MKRLTAFILAVVLLVALTPAAALQVYAADPVYSDTPCQTHSYGSAVTAPTCTEDGFTTYTCTVCGDSYTADPVEAKGHTPAVLPAKDSTCTDTGLTAGEECSVCHAVLVAQVVTDAQGHSILYNEAKKPTYTQDGWDAYETCLRCDYTTFGGMIPALGAPKIESYEELVFNLALLEQLADMYVDQNPGKDAAALVIKYIRTGVDRYNSGSWGIMAGYEDVGFAKFVSEMENMINADLPEEEYLKITGLKNIEKFYLPNGDWADVGHIFGAMDITYHNKGSQNHADVSGWAGDLVDLLEFADKSNVSGTLDEMITEIGKNNLCQTPPNNWPGMSKEDFQGDLDAICIIDALYALGEDYQSGNLTEIFTAYFTEELNDVQRAEYFLKNRLGTTSTRTYIRKAVYNAYSGNKLITTLEGTREFTTQDLMELRKAVCYAFADYVCSLAGDYVADNENRYYDDFSSTTSDLAPGVTQETHMATSADGKQMVYYIATADLSRGDVFVQANYNNCDPTSWEMSRVLDQANAAQQKYGTPSSQHYIPNYKVVAAINGDGYNMSTGEPGGLLIMNGQEYHAIDGGGFFGITKDGVAIIGTQAEYNNIYKGQLKDAIGGFGATLIKDGQIVVSHVDNHTSSRASRTAVGITKTGKVVFMVLDGRQEPFSCGGSMQEIAQIMYEAGCYQAINLDGGGSTTFVSRPEGEEALAVLNRPSDGAPRSVSTSLIMVSTAPSSTEFDHARIDSAYNYATVGTPVQLTPVGLSATGNVTDLPEGVVWEVSNSRWATISDDGVFTGLRTGSVEVYLKLDGNIIGRKTMNLVVPESVYFQRTTMDAVYGSSVELPAVALFEGKQVAISGKDITFTLSNSKTGTISGFTFQVAENSGVKSVKISAALTDNADGIGGSMTVNLYRQGENSFDFDKATGGDRQLAFDRTVSNAVTFDSVTYDVVDSAHKMVTSYTFAMDMTQIPIPEELSDLVYMLPGADMEGASAWTFLLQLAERVSVLTEVTPVLRFDPNFQVDYSELVIKNEYFTLVATEFDEATNSLTMRLKWIDQTTAIDPATANPICLVSGIKLTPKDDANWDAKNRLNAVHSGTISYKVYLRASALYSFASKPENQRIYGLVPFVNPDLPSEAGAYFGDIYKEFEDSYTLVNAKKNGWYSEENGFAYYLQGVRMYGIREVDGFYYDFGDNGINVGQTRYTGLIFDSETGDYFYAKNGVLEGGWQSIGGNWHFFNRTTFKAVSGTQKVGGVTYEFEADGRVKSGVWVNVVTGWRYYYGPSYYLTKWKEIDGNWYYFRDGNRVTGYSVVDDKEFNYIRKWFNFGEDGIARELERDGFYEFDGKLYYLIDGVSQKGLHKIDGDYYFFTYDGPAIRGQSYYAWETHCDLPCDTYAFGLDGKMVNGIAQMNDGYYYYVNGKINWQNAGLHKIGDDYYFINTAGKCVTGPYYAWATFCDLPCGNYEFGADGKMLSGIVEKADGYYYYVGGKIDWTLAGLHKIGDDYYFVNTAGKCVTGPYYAWATFCDLPCGNYEFGADGKMLHGIAQKDDGYYYYVNGQIDWTQAGLHKIGEDYYFVNTAGKCVTGPYYAWATFCDLPCGNYEFGADGKMLQGIVEKADGHYYYVNGRIDWQKAGLHKIGDDYYFVNTAGKCVTGSYYAWATFCDLPCNNYEFGADGKMLQGIVEKADGHYYYVNGHIDWTQAGLHKIGDDYYCINTAGKCVTGSYYAWATFCDLPCGEYEFGADGKMLHGFIEKEDGIYVYVNGKPGSLNPGLAKIGDYYYFIDSRGKCVTGTYYAWATNCDLPIGKYEFDAEGRMLDGFIQKADGIYYYDKGKIGTVGVNYIDGHYYFIGSTGRLVTNQNFYVWETNGLILESTYVFNELGQILKLA